MEDDHELDDIFSQLRDAEWATQRDVNLDESDEPEDDSAADGVDANAADFGVYHAPDAAGLGRDTEPESSEDDDDEVQLVQQHVTPVDVIEIQDSPQKRHEEACAAAQAPARALVDPTPILMDASKRQMHANNAPGAPSGASRRGAKAARVGGRGGGRGGYRPPRAMGPVPFYKRVPGTSFIVDGFPWQGPACSQYFLTHFHADHYGGLRKSFKAGIIYCSPVTARLLELRLGVVSAPKGPVVALPWDTPVVIPASNGVRVTLLDANHCPGAAMMLFEVPVPGVAGRYRAYLHTGDMRWHPRLASHPALQAYCGRLTTYASSGPGALPSPWASAVSLGSVLTGVYLDTTYASPGKDFPSQAAVVQAATHIAVAAALRDPGVLLLFGAYSIGKERLFLSVARALKDRIYAPPAKLATLRAAGLDPADEALLTDDPSLARIHVVPMAALTLARLTAQLRVLQAHAAAITAAHGPSGAQGQGSLTQLQLVNRSIRTEASAAAAIAAVGSKRKLPAFAAVAGTSSKVPASLAGKARGRGGAFAALLAQSRAAASLQAAAQPPAAARPVQAAASGHAPSSVGSSSIAARSSSPSPRTFHSIVAFKPTGWVHSTAGSSASAGGSSGYGQATGSAPRPVSTAGSIPHAPMPGPAPPAAGYSSDLPEDTDLVATQGPRRSASTWDRGDDDDEALPWTGTQTVAGLAQGSTSGTAPPARAAQPHQAQAQPQAACITVKHTITHGAEPSYVTDSHGPQTLDVTVPSSQAGRPETVRVTYQTRGSTVMARTMMDAILGQQGAGSAKAGSSISSGCALLLSVPYSEHSSLHELRDAVATFAGSRAGMSGQAALKIIPTVNCRSSYAAQKTVELLTGSIAGATS